MGEIAEKESGISRNVLDILLYVMNLVADGSYYQLVVCSLMNDVYNATPPSEWLNSA
jgi:hypothetical protein